MRVVVTGSAGHLGEGLIRTLLERGDHVVAVDVRASHFTTHVGSVLDSEFMAQCMRGCDVVFHCASLHKRHLGRYSGRDFIDTNIAGTLSALEASVGQRVLRFVYTSSTSVYGAAFKPVAGAPSVMVDEELQCVPKDIYGVTKKSAEDLCELFARKRGLPCTVLRVGRFYSEPEGSAMLSESGQSDRNYKVNDFLYRRVDLADVVDAHMLAARQCRDAPFRRYVVSATSPFRREHLSGLRTDTAGAIRALLPEHVSVFQHLGWKVPDSIDRVYCNDLARRELGWQPQFDFMRIVTRIREGQEPFSELSRLVGSKAYG